MPVVGLLTTLTQMSTHRSGIQGTKGAWGRVGAGGILVHGLHSCQGFGTACSQQQEQNKSPTHSACVEDSPQSTPTASVGGLHLPFPVIWSHRVWGQDSGRDIKFVIKMGAGQKEKKATE